MNKKTNLELIQMKISEVTGTYFLTHNEFEKQFIEHKDKIIESLIWLIKRYDHKVILMKGSQFSLRDYLYRIRPKSNNFKEKKIAIKHTFWKYFNDSLSKSYDLSYRHYEDFIDSSRNFPEKIITNFRTYYLSSPYFKLYLIAEKNITDEKLTALDKVIINVGKQTIELASNGWKTSNFQVFNCKKTYSFSQSFKDEKLTEGEFINIFIFQTTYLIKISITSEEVERTPFIIHRDCEKVSLKNECELVIIKHHGNETIIFDTKEEALYFQKKLIERREGKR